MAGSPITRRSMLRASAGALAAAALRPVAGAAAAGDRAARALGHGANGPLRTIALGTLAGTRSLDLPAGVAVAGLRWRGGAGAHPLLRVKLSGGSFGPWVSARGHGHGPDLGTTPAAHTGEPLWIGGARRLELRTAQPLADAELLLVLEGSPLPAESLLLGGRASSRDLASAAALPLAQPVLATAGGQPPVIARSTWAKGVPPPRVAPEYGQVALAFVHHTENPNEYSASQVPAMLRAIYLFHREGNGWNDIGYNFVIDLFGRVWEARAGGIDEPVTGAHAGGYNYVSTGIALLGSFSGTPISAAARRSLQQLLAWKLSLHGTPAAGRVTVRVNPQGASYSKYPARARVSLRRISGHRDGDSTECPGDALYAQLPAIAHRALALTGDAARLTLALLPAAAATPPTSPPAAAPSPATPGVSPAPGASPGTPTAASEPAQAPLLQVALTRLDGSPLAGAPVQLQVRTVAEKGQAVTRTKVAEGLTEANGLCTFAASFAVGAAKPLWVRALYLGSSAAAAPGAAVSRAVKVAPVPAPTPAAPAPTPTAAPAPSS